MRIAAATAAAAAAAVYGLISLTHAQTAGYGGGYGGFDGFGGSNNPYTGGTGSVGGTAGTGSTGFGGNPYSSGGSNFLGLSFAKAETLRTIHGILAALAFVIFFPGGAITIRLIPSKYVLWLHAACQILAYFLFIAAFGIGFYLVSAIQIDFIKLPQFYHGVIGILVFAFITVQPILGILHHLGFKKYKRRTIWSHFHLWIGRIAITLGIVNGGLGLSVSGNGGAAEIAYGIIAGIIWLIWMAAAIANEIKRARPKAEPSIAPPEYTYHNLANYPRDFYAKQESGGQAD